MKNAIRLLILASACMAFTVCECDKAACFEEPTVVNRLEIRDAQNGVLWRLIGDGRSKVKELEYGSVPEGYVQTYPRLREPRPLKTSEPILLLWRSADSFMRHWGFAAGPSTIHYGMWEGMSSKGRTDSELFIDAPRTIDREKGYPRDLPRAKRGAG